MKKKKLFKKHLVIQINNNKKDNSDIEKKESLDTENKEEPYPAAPILLDVAKDEYTKERERANILDNKASIFISAIIAMITIFIPIIPFNKFIGLYVSGTKLQIIIATTSVCVFVLAVVFLTMAFYNLYNAIKLKGYKRVCFEDINDENIILRKSNVVERGLIDHYYTILKDNSLINDQKATKVTLGLKYSIVGFLLLALSTIILIIIV